MNAKITERFGISNLYAAFFYAIFANSLRSRFFNVYLLESVRYLSMEHSREKEIYKVTVACSAVNALLVVFKFVAGVLGHSSAMIADAVHSLSDFITDVVVIVFVRIAGKPADADHDYGHGKYETLAAVIVGLFLGLVGIGLGIGGVEKTVAFFKGVPQESPNWLAFSAALLSLVLKEWSYRYTMTVARRVDSPALVANAWHHRSDAFTSVAALAGIGGAMLLGPAWTFLDPLAAIIVCLFIIKSAYDLLRPALDELLEKSLPAADKERIAEVITSTPGVLAFHRLCTRRIGVRTAIDVHIKMDGRLSLSEAHDIASAAERRLKEALGENTVVNIHMEPR